MSYKCEACAGAKPVTLLLVNLTNGGTDQACTDDTPLMLIGNLALALDVDAQRLYDVIQKFTVREANREQKLLDAAQATAVVQGQQPEPDGQGDDDQDDDDPDEGHDDAPDLAQVGSDDR